MSLGLDLDIKTSVDIRSVNDVARQRLPELLAEWLPGGRRQGHEYVVLNPNRADRAPGSFKVNLASGRWSDFATDDAGGDPTSLFAFLRGLDQVEAARAVAHRLGIRETVATVATVAGGKRGNGHAANAAAPEDWRPIIPVPADAPKIADSFVNRLAPAGMKLEEGYSYFTLAGQHVGVVARYFGMVDGKRTKSFKPFMFCQGSNGVRQWRCKGFPLPRPLYGGEHLAERPGAPVLVVEGERKTHAAERLFTSHIVLTSQNGARSPIKTDWSPLAGRDVIVWPDADAPGSRYAADVAELAREAGANTVRVVHLPLGLPEGWDLADDLPECLTRVDLDRLLAEAEPIGVKVESAAPDGPLPLFPELPPAEPYPVEALGPMLGRAAKAIARKVQVPEAMAAQSVLAAAALSAQAHADVMLPYGQARPLSLFFVTVAASGDRKSSADNEALWPVTKHEKTLREENVEAMKVWNIEHGAWSAQKRKIESDGKLDYATRKERLLELGEEPLKPLAPFLTTGDLTIEGLTKNWINAHAALGIFTAEAGIFTGGHGMSDDARLRTAAMLSEVWDGKPIKRVRALDGVTILPGRRLSMHLMVQPDAAAGFLGNSALRDQGLLSRVLVAAPGSLAGTRFHREVEPADNASIRAYGARILRLLEAGLPLAEETRNELDPPALVIDADAKNELAAFADHIEHQLGAADGLKPIGDFAAKIAELAARIAGVLTIVGDHRASTISPEVMSDAVTLADWYVNEADRLHKAGRRDPKLLNADALLRWLREQRGEVDFRDVLRLGPNHLRVKAEAEAALRTLIEHGWIIEISPRPRRFKVVDAGAPR